MLEWNDFRVFLAVARAGTLSGAARQLKVNQSTTSRRLAALEKSLGARLFDRKPSGYSLTTAGQAVLSDIENVEASATAVERKLLGHDARPTGSVRLATSDSLATWYLIPRMPGFVAAHPGLTLALVTGNKPLNLARREADLSLRLVRPSEPNLIARKLGQGAWALYGSRDYLARRGRPRSHDLARHDVVGFDPELRGTAGAVWLAKHARRAHVVLSTNSLTTQAAAVAAGLGLSPLPCLIGDVDPAVERALPGVIGHHDIWLVVHPDVKDSARVRAVTDFLTRTLEADAALLSGRHSRQLASPRALAR